MIENVRRNRFLVLGFVLGAIAIALLGLTIPPGEVNGSPVAFILCCLIFPVGGGFIGSLLDEAHPQRPKPAPAPRTTYHWQTVSNARRLADEARDHATKAAALGLPTGEWTDLAAFWTAWADTEEQDGTGEAAETPVERPTPPKGGGGVGNVMRAQLEEIDRRIKALEPRKTGVLAAKAGKTTLPFVRAYDVPRGAVYVHVPTCAVQVFTVPPTSGPRGRKDLVVITGEDRIEYRVGYVAPAPGDTVLGELVIPPHTAAITQAVITDRRTFKDHVHTVEMKGAPATEHEVPCDCDTVTAGAFVDEINAMKAELHERS